jgi:putative Holliday junction resolvase
LSQSPAPPKRFLAVDFGDRRTGLAATDWTGSIRVPLPAIVGRDDATCAREIAELATDREAEAIVVGLPLDGDGQVGPRAQRTLGFVAVLRRATSIPVHTVDEAYSTDEAHARLKDLGVRAAKRRQVADSVAAMVILERFLAFGPDRR